MSSEDAKAIHRAAEGRRILVVAAHPDDMELLCAGTLAVLRSAGYEIQVAHLTYGDKGGREDPMVLARTREDEAARSAQLIGATVSGRVCGDLELYLDPKFCRLVGALIDEFRPEVVLTHRPDDYHPDHRITGELVLSAAQASTIRCAVWFMDSVGGVNFMPTHVVDISEAFATKAQMIRCHESQMAWMSKARNTDMVYMVEWTGRWRGLMGGFEIAEAFQPAFQPSSWFAPEIRHRVLKEMDDDG